MPVPAHFIVKSREECYKHFTDRLIERYNIEITRQEYDDLPNKKVKVLFTKKVQKTIRMIEIKDTEVCALFDSERELFLTCYPTEVFKEMLPTLMACFGKGPLFLVAKQIYEMYIQESETLPVFSSLKDAGLFFYATPAPNVYFPVLHFMKYKKGYVDPFQIIRMINSIIRNKHPRTKLSLTIKPEPLN